MRTTETFIVTGMTCDHCVAAVESEVAKIDGVQSVEADLDSGRVTVESAAPIAHEDFVAAVDEAGYEVAP